MPLPDKSLPLVNAQMLTNIAEAEPYVPIYNADYLAVIKSGLNFNGFDGMWWMRRWVDDITTN